MAAAHTGGGQSCGSDWERHPLKKKEGKNKKGKKNPIRRIAEKEKSTKKPLTRLRR